MRQATTTGQKAKAKPAPSRASRAIVPGDVGEPLLYTIRQAGAKLSLSYPTVERLIARGELFSVKADGKRLIPAWATLAYTRGLCEQADSHGRYTADIAHEYGLAV